MVLIININPIIASYVLYNRAYTQVSCKVRRSQITRTTDNKKVKTELI
jgi:hypothetical protein